MVRTVIAERLKEGTTLLVKGKLGFSRLTKHIDGDALTQSIARARARGALYPTTKPHTTVSLLDPQVLPLDPTALSPEEIFLTESMFTFKEGDNAGRLGFSLDDKSPSLPPVLTQNEDGSFSQVQLDAELAADLDVTLVLQVFKQGDYEKRGIGIDKILVNEPIRYFSGGAGAAALAARGIVVQGPVTAVNPNKATEGGESDGSLPANTVISEAGLPMPAPAQTAPVAQAPVQTAPVVQAAPVETAEQMLARLEQENAALRAASAASGNNSAFDAAPAVPAVTAQTSPWDETPAAGISYTG